MSITINDIPDIPGGYDITGKKIMVHDTDAPEEDSTKLILASDLGGSGSVSASNGLSSVDGDVSLGGTLIRNTDIYAEDFDFTISTRYKNGVGPWVPRPVIIITRDTGSVSGFPKGNRITIGTQSDIVISPANNGGTNSDASLNKIDITSGSAITIGHPDENKIKILNGDDGDEVLIEGNTVNVDTPYFGAGDINNVGNNVFISVDDVAQNIQLNAQNLIQIGDLIGGDGIMIDMANGAGIQLNSPDGVGIGTSPSNKAALHINGNGTKGFMPPVLTDTERNAIITPPEGLQAYNSTTHKPNYFDGNTWKSLDGRPYRVFTARINQQGGNFPYFPTILENTLGYTPVFNRDSPGKYSCSTFTSETDFSKIVFFVTERLLDITEYPIKITFGITSEDGTAELRTYRYNSSTHDYDLGDDVIGDAGDNFWCSTIEVRIYN